MNGWQLLGESIICAVLALSFVAAAVTLSVTGHDVPSDLWTAAFTAGAYAVGSARGKGT